MLNIKGHGEVTFGEWKDAGLEGVKERFSLSKYNIWTWDKPESGSPIQQEAYIVQRQTTLRNPNVKYFIYSVPSDERGYSNSFKDYWSTARFGYEVGYVYRGFTYTLEEMMEWAIPVFECEQLKAQQSLKHYEERLETCKRIMRQ